MNTPTLPPEPETEETASVSRPIPAPEQAPVPVQTPAPVGPREYTGPPLRRRTPSTPAESTRRRSRSSRSKRRMRMLLRIVITVATAVALLILWQDVAHSMNATPAPADDPLVQTGSDATSQPAKPQADPAPASDAPMVTPADTSPTPASANTDVGEPAGLPDGPVEVPDFSAHARRLQDIPDDELKFGESLDLLLALEKEFIDLPPAVDLNVLRQDLIQSLIALSVNVPYTDNPRDNLDGIRMHLTEVIGLSMVENPVPRLERLLPRGVLHDRRGSALGISLLVLSFAERLSTYLDLEPILAGDQIALRYRSGDHHYILAPRELSRLLTNQEFAQIAFGEIEGKRRFRILTRQQLWGLVMGEAGAALLAEGHEARAGVLLRRSLSLFSDHPLAHIALARLMMQRREYTDARQELDLALSLSPDHLTGRLARSELLQILGDADAVEADLVWLSRRAKHPRSAVALVRHYLKRRLYRDAEDSLRALRGLKLPRSLEKDVERLVQEVGAGPWIERLVESANDSDRFRAIDELLAYPLRQVLEALADTLDDANLRLGTYAWQALRKLTHMDIPRDSRKWHVALRRRNASQLHD